MQLFRFTTIVLMLMLATSTAFGREQGISRSSEAEKLWREYKKVFIQDDGRVIDRQQQDISHSEGQGFGMLNAVIYDDRSTFDSVWRWTQGNMSARSDNLLPWSWGRRQNGQWGVIDHNNATDGDLLVAYALINAAKRWHVIEYRNSGLQLIGAIRRELTTNFAGQSFLMPAYYGFHETNGLVLNPSYVIFSAYRTFAEIDNREYWQKLYQDGRSLVERSSFGTIGLPSDWVVLRLTGVEAWAEKEAVFGYDAIRIILYLSWEKNPRFPAGLNKLFTFYEKRGYIPADIDLYSDLKSTGEAPAGFYAVFACAAEKMKRHELAKQLWRRSFERAKSEKDNYYSMSLLLLALGNGGL